MSVPGTLLHSEQIPTSILNATAWRVRYTSRDVNGRAHEVTGLVIAPADAGIELPVMTWCHGTTGLGDAACPSAQPDPARELTVYFSPEATQSIDYGVPGLQSFIDAGWLVCATDYQGLGTEGMHQYIVNRTNARDAINIVHAARQMDLGAGATVAVLGWSQGGGAAAAAAELDDDDYRGLTLLGTVPMSPGVPAIALSIPTGPAGALADSSVAPDSHLVMMLCGFATANPDLDLGDILTPLGLRILDAAWNAQAVHHLNDTIARYFRLEGPIISINPAAMDAWKKAITAGSAAQRTPCCPVLMCVDSFDGGTVVPVTWQDAYLDAVTKLGGEITSREYPKDDHFSLPQSCVADALAWLKSLR